MATISSNIQQVRARIAKACDGAKRPVQSVTLLCVSKTFGPDAVRVDVWDQYSLRVSMREVGVDLAGARRPRQRVAHRRLSLSRGFGSTTISSVASGPS